MLSNSPEITHILDDPTHRRKTSSSSLTNQMLDISNPLLFTRHNRSRREEQRREDSSLSSVILIMALKDLQIALERVQTLEHVIGSICLTSAGTCRSNRRCASPSSASSGVPIRSTFDDELTRNLVTQLQPFLDRIKRTIHRLALKELVELRLTTSKFVYLLRSDSLCSFIVVQKHDKSRYGIEE